MACLLLGLLRQPGENKWASSSKGSSSLLVDLAQTLPTLGSASSVQPVNSKTTGITNRTSNKAVLSPYHFRVTKVVSVYTSVSPVLGFKFLYKIHSVKIYSRVSIYPHCTICGYYLLKCNCVLIC